MVHAIGKLRCGLALCVLGLFALAPTASAQLNGPTYIEWPCKVASAKQCYKGTGNDSYYWYWMRVGASMSATSSSVCAKVVSVRGTVKARSGCGSNTRYFNACITNFEPPANPYVYWTGSGTIRTIEGWASTTACD